MHAAGVQSYCPYEYVPDNIQVFHTEERLTDRKDEKECLQKASANMDTIKVCFFNDETFYDTHSGVLRVASQVGHCVLQ